MGALELDGVPASARAVTAGFSAWLRVQHFLNLLFMAFIIRARIQVLADHPRNATARPAPTIATARPASPTIAIEAGARRPLE